MTDRDVISHLVSVEQEADKVVEEAELKAEKIIAACRNNVDLKFNGECDKIVADMDAQFSNQRVKIKDERRKAIDDYSEQLEKTQTDPEAAFLYLRKILFRGAE